MRGYSIDVKFVKDPCKSRKRGYTLDDKIYLARLEIEHV